MLSALAGQQPEGRSRQTSVLFVLTVEETCQADAYLKLELKITFDLQKLWD